MFKKIVFELGKSGSQKSPKVRKSESREVGKSGKSESPKVRKGAGVIRPKAGNPEKSSYGANPSQLPDFSDFPDFRTSRLITTFAHYDSYRNTPGFS